MGFHIVRLVVTSWPDAMLVIRQRGVDFYWLDQEEAGEPIVPPFALKYDGALVRNPASRELDARDWYNTLRPHLGPIERCTCDAHFSSLFWAGEKDNRTTDLSTAGISCGGIWNALSPEHVHEQLELSDRVPWDSLAAAFLMGASLMGATYLPEFEDFEDHLKFHKEHLIYAAKRRAGVLSLTSY